MGSEIDGEEKLIGIGFLILLVTIASIGLYWLARLKLDAGPAYLWLVLAGGLPFIGSVVWKMAGSNHWFELPISGNLPRGLLMFYFGIGSMAAFVFAAKFTPLSTYTPFLMAPLNTFSTGIGAETFSALQAATSPFWTFFIIVISAAVIEELVLGFFFVKTGSALSHLIFGKMIGLYDDSENADFVGAIAFSIVFFTVFHVFNSTYAGNTTAFMFAAAFRLLLNVFIYKFGNFGLLYSIGAHAYYNAFILGMAVVVAALTTFPAGIVLSVLILITLIYTITHIPEMIREGELVRKDFPTWD